MLFVSKFFVFAYQGFFALVGRASQLVHSFFIIDLESPVWLIMNQSKSVINRTNSVVLFAYWSDNIGLNYAWLVTNETGEWKIKTGVYGSPKKLNGTLVWSNFTWLNPSVSGVIGWKVYANDTAGNENLTGISTFEVVAAPQVTTISPAYDITPKGVVSIKNFTINPDLIKVSIKQEETQTKSIEISNTGDAKLNISIDLQNLKKFVLVSEENFELESNKSKTITLDFTASEDEIPDVYTGKLLVTGDGIERIVRLIIEVKEKRPLFDIKVMIPENFRIVEIGKNVKADIFITNLGKTKPIDVIFEYSIKDLNGNTIGYKHEILTVENELLISRELRVPEISIIFANIVGKKLGDYLFYAKLSYDNYTATSSDLFEIVLEKEMPLIMPATKIAIGFVVVIISSIVVLKVYQKYIAKKEEEKLRLIKVVKEFGAFKPRKEKSKKKKKL